MSRSPSSRRLLFFLFFSPLQPTSILPPSSTQELSLHFNLDHSSCVRRLNTPHLTPSTFTLHYLVDSVALHPTWLHSVECQSGRVCTGSRLCAPAQTSVHFFFFFFLSMFIFKVVSDLVRGHRRPHKLLELMFSCCAENPLDYNLVLCSGNLPTSTQICFDFLNLVPSSERNTFWWRNKTCIHSWWSPCWNNNRYHADRVFFVSGKKKMRVNMLFSAVSFNKSLVYNLWKPKTAVMCIMWRSVAAFKTNRR